MIRACAQGLMLLHVVLTQLIPLARRNMGFPLNPALTRTYSLDTRIKGKFGPGIP